MNCYKHPDRPAVYQTAPGVFKCYGCGNQHNCACKEIHDGECTWCGKEHKIKVAGPDGDFEIKADTRPERHGYHEIRWYKQGNRFDCSACRRDDSEPIPTEDE